jgi:hypothetical protein
MTYAQNSLILAADYNNFVSTGSPNVNNIWSTGSGSSGYGQTALSTVSQNAIILAGPWSNLINSIASMAAHQGTAITAIPAITSGQKISYLSAIAPNLSAVNTNKLNSAATGTDIVNSATRTTPWGPSLGLSQLDSTITVTFSSADAVRYFFNAGGTIRVTCSRSGGSAFPANTSWTNLCTDIGSLALPATSATQSIAGTTFNGLTKLGGGSLPNTYVRNGYYQLTAAPALLFKQFSNVGVYTNDHIEVYYSASGNTVTITVRFSDIESGYVPTGDVVDGNLTVTAAAKPPSTANIANSWGTPTVSVTAPA